MDEHLFHNGLSIKDDIDKYFDKFERMGLIYISRNKQPIIISKNTFKTNMGTFGGAITINSPDW